MNCRFTSKDVTIKHNGSAFHPVDTRMWKGHPQSEAIIEMLNNFNEVATSFMIQNKLQVYNYVH